MEFWTSIKGYEGYYEVSNLGEVRSVDREYVVKRNGTEYVQRAKSRIRKLHTRKDGYLQTDLNKDAKHKNVLIHRLVAEAFIENPNNLKEVNHIDGDKTNNTVKNLEWVNGSENVQHAFKVGINKTKLTDAQYLFIIDNYIPYHPVYGAKAFAERFGVSKGTISSIANGKRIRKTLGI
jgi:NUMOD4 motif/HNH endonuclease